MQTMKVAQVARGLGVNYRQALKFAVEQLGAYQLVPRGEVYVPVASYVAFCGEKGIDPKQAFAEEA